MLQYLKKNIIWISACGTLLIAVVGSITAVFTAWGDSDKRKTEIERIKSENKGRKISNISELVKLQKLICDSGIFVVLSDYDKDELFEKISISSNFCLQNKNSNRTLEFSFPLERCISRPFGWSRHPVTRRRTHNDGIVISAKEGDAVRSSESGEIVFSDWRGALGYTVIVKHSFHFSTVYGNLSSLSKKIGDQVSRGEIIARAGRTGLTAVYQLHFELIVSNKNINPEQLLPAFAEDRYCADEQGFADD